MPLLIDLKPGEKLIINGAVIENTGANTKLRVYNESNVLRQKEILTEEDVTTPAARVYYSLQNAYIFPERRDHYLNLFAHFLAEFVAACPSATPIGMEISDEALKGNYYRALKMSRKLLAHEASVLEHLQSSAERVIAALGQDPAED